jgi:hypothetical protein
MSAGLASARNTAEAIGVRAIEIRGRLGRTTGIVILQ